LSGMPYVGCGVLSSAICMDKSFAKIVARDIGLRQAEYTVARAWDQDSIAAAIKRVQVKIKYPCFVKPANAGSSVGISKVKDKKGLPEAIEAAARIDGKVIIEKAVEGRELECAVLGFQDNVQASAVGEILPAADFYDYDAKYNSSESKTLIPADIPAEAAEEIRRQAVEMFKAVDGRGMARVDFFLENDTDRVIFNEINTIPGFTPISMYPKLWQASDLSLPDLIDRLIEIALL